MQPTLISIIGPTAIGKTTKSIALAKAMRTEIISADSRQFYREMRIGTAVPSAAELGAVPHHFIQHISVSDAYDVGNFEQEALTRLEKLFKTHQCVFMVGGSGLYLQAVNEGLNAFPKIDPAVREKLNQAWKEKGIRFLQEELTQVDPAYAKKVDLQNARRLIRALEVYRSSGKPYSYYLNKEKPRRPFSTLKIGLEAPREILYKRIEQRVDIMMEEGLLEEAKRLYPQRHYNALNTIGYRELYRYLANECSLEFAIDEIKKNTRRFAKRQLTWFRRDKTIQWFPYDCTAETIMQFIEKQIA